VMMSARADVRMCGCADVRMWWAAKRRIMAVGTGATEWSVCSRLNQVCSMLLM